MIQHSANLLRTLTLLVALSCLPLLTGQRLHAQTKDYKYFQQHFSEYSDREAIYHLLEFQRASPQKPVPYYQLGNIYYRIYPQEHALTDYHELSQALYNARLFYGNCRAYLMNDRISKDNYPETAINGKVSEGTVLMYLSARIDTLTAVSARVDSLYHCYCNLVNRYDSCLQDMAAFSAKYPGEKMAQLLLVDDDIRFLNTLADRAALLPADIQLFQEALEAYPLPDYHPQFTFQPIRFFRVQGLTTSNFLTNEVQLWDFAAWVRQFMAEYEVTIPSFRQTMLDSWTNPAPVVANLIEQRDPSSPMAELFRIKHILADEEALSAHVQSVDSVVDEEWLPLLQQTYRVFRMKEAVLEMTADLQSGLDDPMLMRKYSSFIATYFPDENWSSAATTLRNQAQDAYMAALRHVLRQPTRPDELQISETMRFLTDHFEPLAPSEP